MWWIKPWADHLVVVAVIGCGVLVLVAACTRKLNQYSILVTWGGGEGRCYTGCMWEGGVVTRHSRLYDCIVEVCCHAHIGVQIEVGNNLTPSQSKTRPADILIPNWVMGRTAALDVSVTSPLNPQILLEAVVIATAAAIKTEARQHGENNPKCAELGWVCIPVVAESFGAWGERSHATVIHNCLKNCHPEQQT